MRIVIAVAMLAVFGLGCVGGPSNNPFNNAPIASIDALESEYTGGQIAFDASNSIDLDGYITQYEWDFDFDLVNFDPEPGYDSKVVVYTYMTEGTYRIGLRITDNGGAQTITTHDVIIMLGTVPVAYFSWTPASPDMGADIYFTNLSTDSTGSLVSWIWSFTDGTPPTSTTQHPLNVRFSSPGFKDVTLTVTSSGGLTATITQTVPVIDPNDSIPPMLDVTGIILKGTATGVSTLTSLTDDQGIGGIADDGTADETSETFTTHEVVMGSSPGDVIEIITISAEGDSQVSIDVTTVVINGIASDTGGVAITVGGRDCPVTSGTWMSQDINVSSTPISIVVLALDTAGNSIYVGVTIAGSSAQGNPSVDLVVTCTETFF